MNKKCSFFTQNLFKKLLISIVVIIFFPAISQSAITSGEFEEKIGTHTHASITELQIPNSSRYEHLDWWLSALPVIKQTAGIEEFDTYEKIVKSSLNQMGLIYKISEREYIGQMFADGLGFGLVSDDFETAFNKKLGEFEIFSKSYLKSNVAKAQETQFEAYSSNEKLFSTMIQKKDMLGIERYQIIHVGDLHGDLISLLTILKNNENCLNTDFSLKDKSKFFIFTGDYIDRGQFGLEILYILISLKIKNPDNVFLLLGNHEADFEFLAGWNQGFAREVAQKFDFGTLEFDQTNHKIFGPGAASFAKFMNNLQSKVFKYLPSALFMTTEFGNIIFCHGLPDPKFQTLVTQFLEHREITTWFVNQHPSLTFFTNGDIAIKMPTLKDINPESRPAQPLDLIGKYMDETGIFLCMRGHQHNATIEAAFEIQYGGIIQHQSSKKSLIITTLSFDIACCASILQIIGNYAFCYILNKEDSKLKGQGFTIDRYTAKQIKPSDRINPEFEIHSIAETHPVMPLYSESKKLSESAPQVFSCPDVKRLQESPLWVIENIHYFFSQIQNMYKIDVDIIYELFFLLDIMNQDGSLSVGKITTLSPEEKLELIQIMRDEVKGPFGLISNIKKIRKELANYAFRTDNPQKFNAQFRDCLHRINQNRFLLGEDRKSVV